MVGFDAFMLHNIILYLCMNVATDIQLNNSDGNSYIPVVVHVLVILYCFL